jgi:hypothetical protein
LTKEQFSEAIDAARARFEASKTSEEEMANLYLAQVKWSILDEENHAGWPVRSFLMEPPEREKVLAVLTKRFAAEPSPIIAYALIPNACYANNIGLFNEVIRYLNVHDEFLFVNAAKCYDSYWRLSIFGQAAFQKYLSECSNGEVRCLWPAEQRRTDTMQMQINLEERTVHTAREVYGPQSRSQEEARELSSTQVTSINEVLKDLPQSTPDISFEDAVQVAFWDEDSVEVRTYPLSDIPVAVRRLYDIGGGKLPAQ